MHKQKVLMATVNLVWLSHTFVLHPVPYSIPDTNETCITIHTR